MNLTESSVILSHHQTFQNIENHCRLLHNTDGFHNLNVFSVLITTIQEQNIDEEFVYDISRDFETAKAFFTLICNQNVTALSLRDIAEDFLAER